MISVLIFAALISASEQPVAADDGAMIPGDTRTFCTGDSTISTSDEPAAKSTGVGFSRATRRAITLKSGQRVLVQEVGGRDELVVEEDGRYRRVVDGKMKIHSLFESPDGKHLAVAVVYKSSTEVFRSPSGGIYLFNTETWIGEQIVKMVGLSGLAWSPDNTVLAYGDNSKVRFFDLEKNKSVETCGVDSQTTPDTDERISQLRFEKNDRLTFTYQNPRGSANFVVVRK